MKEVLDVKNFCFCRVRPKLDDVSSSLSFAAEQNDLKEKKNKEKV